MFFLVWLAPCSAIFLVHSLNYSDVKCRISRAFGLWLKAVILNLLENLEMPSNVSATGLEYFKGGKIMFLSQLFVINS